MNAYMIPANAQNPKAAMQYIASTAIPEREATYMRMFSYSGPNTAAFSLLTPEQRALQVEHWSGNRLAAEQVEWWQDLHAEARARIDRAGRVLYSGNVAT